MDLICKDLARRHYIQSNVFFSITTSLVLIFSVVSILSSGDIVFADNFISKSSSLSFDVSSSGVGSWKLVSTNANQPGGDLINGCNASVANPLLMTINTPPGLTATPNPVIFTSCSNSVYKPSTFTATSPGSYDVTISAASTTPQPGESYQTNPGSISVTVTGSTPPIDNTPPIISVPTLARATSTGSTTHVVYSVTATDETSPVTISCTAEGSSVSPTGDYFTDGVTNVSCTATDASGNTSSGSFNVYVSKITIPGSYSTIWNRTVELTVNVIGFVSGDQIQVLRGTTVLASTPAIGDADTSTSFLITLPAFPASDSNTTVTVDAKLVDSTPVIWASASKEIQILRHAISLNSITLETFGFPGSDITVTGVAFDTDDNVPVNGLAMSFVSDVTGTTPPTSSITGLTSGVSSGITITDPLNLSTSSNNLIIHSGTEFTHPNFNGAQITVVNAIAGDYVFELTPVGGGPIEKTYSVAFDGFDVNIEVYLSGIGGIPVNLEKIKLVSTPSSTISISNIQVKNSAIHTIYDISFVGDTVSGTTITKAGGTFSSLGVLGEPGDIRIKADSGVNNQYLAASGLSGIYHVSSGLPAISASGSGSGTTIVSDSGKGFVAIACSTTVGNAAYDTDGDYLCDNMEGTGATNGVPFTINNYATNTSTTKYYKFPGSDKNVKNVYVESDAMVGHAVNLAASNNVKALFATKGITLYHDISQTVPHQEILKLWTDSDSVVGNDFDTFKNIWFGGADENIKFGGTVTVTCTDCASLQSTHNLKISGLQITTPNTALTGGATSGNVILNLKVTPEAGVTAFAQKTIAPTITAGTTGAGLATKALTTSSIVTSGSTNTITVTIPYSTTGAVTANLGEINVQFKTTTTTTGTTLVNTKPTVTLSGSPYVSTSLLDARAQGYHYIPWIHSTAACGSSGQSELVGNDGVVSLGCNFGGTDSAFSYPAGDSRIASSGTYEQQAGTFLHELAHNLGLNHGGPQKLKAAENGFAVNSSPADSGVNCKPQYTSVMSYTRQMPGYLTAAEWVLNLSSGGHSALTETALNEATGVAGSPATIVWSTPASTHGHSYHKALIGPNIDWNDSGSASGTVSADINNFGISGCNTASISNVPSYDWNDWNHLDFNLRSGSFGQFDGQLGELNGDLQKQITIINLYYPGFSNPPPYDDATQNTAKSGSVVPVKVAVYTDSTQSTLIDWAKIRGEFTKNGGTTYIPMDCGGTDKFTLESNMFKCNWKTPTGIKANTKLFFKVLVDTEGANPPAILLKGPIAYNDDKGKPVTSYVTITK